MAAGTIPPETYDVRFVVHHWIAYLHIGPGTLYLLGVPLQLSYRFRSRHYTFHRRLGRLLVGSALLSGVFALVIGLLFPFGGIIQGHRGRPLRAVVPGLLDPGRSGDPPRRHLSPPPVDDSGLAVGVAVGMIRIWLGIFVGLGLLEFEDSFGPAFWISFSLHAVAAELWPRAHPSPPELAQPAAPAPAVT